MLYDVWPWQRSDIYIYLLDDNSSMTRKGVVKERLLQIVSMTSQVTISRRVSRLKLLGTARKQDEAKLYKGGDDRPTPMAWGWSLDTA